MSDEKDTSRVSNPGLSRLQCYAGVIIPVITALVLILPVYIATRDLSFRQNTDYGALLPVYDYIVSYIREKHTVPRIVPFVGGGLPVFADPQSFLFQPLFMIPVITLGVDNGLRAVILVSSILSGIGMWFLLTKLKLDDRATIWGAILYQSSGAFGAPVVAGHIGKMMTYGLVPYFMLVVIARSLHLRHMIAAGVLLTIVLLSGDPYYVWFLLLLFSASRIYYAVRQKSVDWHELTAIAVVVAVFLLLSLPKLFLVFRDVYPYARRAFYNAWLGSIHMVYFPVPFLVAAKDQFYGGGVWKKLFGFHFEWFEYYAFISPLSFVPLIRLKHVVGRKEVKLFLVLCLVAALYLALAFPYSPFYWVMKLIPVFRSIRAPQRILMPMTSVVIALLAACASEWLRSRHVGAGKVMAGTVLVCSVLWVGYDFQRTLPLAFEPERTLEQSIVNSLRVSDQSQYFVAVFGCCFQRALVRSGVPIINYYYGWTPKGTETYVSNTGNHAFLRLEIIRPSYILSTKERDFGAYRYRPIIVRDPYVIWKTEDPNIFPNL